MRLQIVQLDPHDDQASARERLRWARAERIVLVWPAHGRVIDRRLDLLLLQREAERQGARLGVVAHDPDVRDHARDLRIPIFDDLDSVTADAWPPVAGDRSRRPLPPTERAPISLGERPRPLTKTRREEPWRGGWVLLVLAALLGLSIVAGPVAVVEITPKLGQALAEFDVTLNGDASDNADPVSIPARTVEAELEGDLRLPTESRVLAPVSAAQGLAMFTNRDQEEVVIPEGTGVRTADDPPIRFETTERSLVPAGVGSQVEVPIRASREGSAGNVDAEAITAVEGALGLEVSVANPEPTSGGRDEETAGVAQVDIDRVASALQTRLLQEANAEIDGTLQDGEALAPDSMKVVSILEQSHRPQVAQPSESVAVSMRLVIAALAYDAARLEAEALSALGEAVGTEDTIVPGSVRIELQPAGVPGRYRAVVRAETAPRIEAADLTPLLIGRAPADASEILTDRIALEETPRFRVWPEWWPRLPFLPWRVRLVWASEP